VRNDDAVSDNARHAARLRRVSSWALVTVVLAIAADCAGSGLQWWFLSSAWGWAVAALALLAWLAAAVSVALSPPPRAASVAVLVAATLVLLSMVLMPSVTHN
jgi:hypothetical protein